MEACVSFAEAPHRAGGPVLPLLVALAAFAAEPAATVLPAAGPELPGATEARPWIGIGLAAGERGVRITLVYPESAGEAAGLQAGDEVIALDGAPVKLVPELQAAIRAHDVGDDVTLRVWRDGAEQDVTLALRAKPDDLALLQGRLVGKPLTPFALKNAQGPWPADSAALAGNVVVIDVFATWCRPCRASMPVLAQWHATYADRGLRIVSVSTEDWVTEIQPFFAANPEPWTVAADEADFVSSKVVGSGVLPTLVVVDRGGVVRFVGVGSGATLAAAEQAFVPLLDAPAPAR